MKKGVRCTFFIGSIRAVALGRPGGDRRKLQRKNERNATGSSNAFHRLASCD
jgi:hypothetical protein